MEYSIQDIKNSLYNPIKDYNFVPMYLRKKERELHKIQEDMAREVFKMELEKLLEKLKDGPKRLLGVLCAFKKKWKFISQKKLGRILNRTREQVSRYVRAIIKAQKELDIMFLTIVSGQKLRIPNKYFISQFIYDFQFKNILEFLISKVPIPFLRSIRTGCHTLIDSIRLRILNTYNKYINSSLKLVTSPPCVLPASFLPHKKEKDALCTHTNKDDTHQDSDYMPGLSPFHEPDKCGNHKRVVPSDREVDPRVVDPLANIDKLTTEKPFISGILGQIKNFINSRGKK